MKPIIYITAFLLMMSFANAFSFTEFINPNWNLISTESGNTQPNGIKILVGNEDITFANITKYTLSTVTRINITNTTGSTIPNGIGWFTGNTGTFSTNPILYANTEYYILFDANGSSKDSQTQALAGFPYNFTYLNITSGVYYSGGFVELAQPYDFRFGYITNYTFPPSVENWYIKGGSKTPSNFSNETNQDFYYEYKYYDNNTFVNMTLYPNCDGLNTEACWWMGASNPKINNRTDFEPFTSGDFLFLHPSLSLDAVVRFKPMRQGIFISNFTLVKYDSTFSNPNYNTSWIVAKNDILSGEILVNTTIVDGSPAINYENISFNLTADDSIVFIVGANGDLFYDSSGLVLNITGLMEYQPLEFFSVIVQDIKQQTNITNFTVNINGTNYTTTTGSVTTNISTLDTKLYNMTIYATGNTGEYIPRTIYSIPVNSYNINPYVAEVYQSIVEISEYEKISNRLLKYNRTQNFTNTSTYTGTWDDQALTNDGDWDTYGYPLNNNQIVKFDLTYLRASYLGKPVLEVKDGVSRTNLSIPIECLLNDDLSVRASSNIFTNGTGYTNWTCLSENNYEYLLRHAQGADGHKIYDVNMWYEQNNITYTVSNTTIPIPVWSVNGNLQNPDGFANPNNAFDFNDTTWSNKTFNLGTGNSSVYSLGKTFNTSTYVGFIKWKAQSIATGATDDSQFKVQVYNGTDWNTIYFEDQQNTPDAKFPSNDSTETIYYDNYTLGVRVTLNRYNPASPHITTFRVYTLEWTESVPFNTTGTGRYYDFLNAGIYELELVNPYPYYDKRTFIEVMPQFNGTKTITDIYDFKVNINATDTYNASPINVFNATMNNSALGFLESITTTNGTVTFNALKRYNYSIRINATGYAYVASNNTATVQATTSSTYNHTFNLFQAESLYLWVYDATTLQLLNTTTVLFALESDTQQYDFYTTSGSYFASNLATGTYTIQVVASNYTSSYYTATVLPQSHLGINTYLYPNTTTSTIQMYIKSTGDDPIQATVTIRRLNNNTYYTVGQKTTDILGFTIFNLADDIQYRVIIDAENYTTREFDFKFYQANSPYVFRLSPTALSQYINYNQYIQYYYTPMNTTLKNQTWTFNWTTYSQYAVIEYTFMVINGTTINVTNEPSGTSITQTLDLSGYSGTFPVTYGFKISNYSVVQIPVVYYIDTHIYYNQTLITTANQFKDELSTAWRTIVALIITIAIAITATQVTGISQAGMMTAIGCTILFTVLGWYYAPLGIIIVLISLALLYITPEGY